MDKRQEQIELLAELESLEKVRNLRKRESGIRYYIPNAMQEKAHLSKAKIILYCGGNRAGKCVSISTMIDTPDGEISVGELYRRGKPFRVYAWDGYKKVVAMASAPFKKDGLHKCYRIEMSDGRFIEAADRHRILTDSGHWNYVDDLAGSFWRLQTGVGEYPAMSYDFSQPSEFYSFHPPTNLEPFRLVRDEDGLNSWRTEPSYPGYCSEDSHQCGVQPPHAEGICQSSAPSLVGAQRQSEPGFCSDGQASRYSDTYQLYEHHHSILDGRYHNEAQYDEPLHPIYDTTCLLFDSERQVSQQRLGELSPQSQSSAEVCSPDYQSQLPSYESPLFVDGNRIISYSSIGLQEVYDFEVEKYHNYFAGGCVHHNSTMGAVELAWHMTREYPDWFPRERRYRHPIKAVVVCDANQKIEKVIEPKINEYLPKSWIRHRRQVGGYLNRIEGVDGGTIDFLSSEQDDMAFEGADWDFYWGDEPQKKKKFDAIMRGLIDRGGRTLLTFTPLVEPWMKEQLIDQADTKRIETFIVDTYDNLFDIKGNPILRKESVDEMASMWDEDTKETRLHGKFFHLRGIVYSEFSEIHQIEFEYTYPDPVIAVLDPHDRQPHHVIWAILNRTDDLFVHTEMAIHCTVEELSKKIRKHEADNGYKMKRRLIDPNFGRKPLITTGRNMIQELSYAGCGGWTEADDPKEEGRLKVKEYLHFDKEKPISHTNAPKLYFHKKRVPMTIHSIRNHQYEEWVGKTADEKDPKEKTKDRDTHGADCIRYLCMSNPKFERMKEEIYELEESPY